MGRSPESLRVAVQLAQQLSPLAKSPKAGNPFRPMDDPAPLSREDKLHILAAEGWLELGCHLDANEELEKVSPLFRAHPHALLVRWQIYAKAKKWDMCLEIGRALTELAPANPQSWISYANSLHFTGQTPQAYDIAEQSLKLHPKDWTLRYNLACYACQLGRIDEASSHLAKAIELGPRKFVQEQALADSDLEPLWKTS